MTHAPTLLVLSPSTGGYYFGAVLSGVARAVAAEGGRAVVVQTLEPGVRSDEIGEPPEFRHRVHWDEVDGAVAITTAVRASYLEPLQAAGVPVAVASTQLPGLVAPSAMPDNHGGTVAAVEHLIAHGHTRIGFVGNLAQRDLRERYTAYCQTLAAHGLEADPDHLYRAPDNGEPGGVGAARAFLAARSRPTAVMTATDRNAIGLVDTLADAGLRVPADLAVVSFDNIEGATFATPALTTVDQPFDEVGALAVRLVLAQVRGGEVAPVPHASTATVVVRASCGCVPGSDGTDGTTPDLEASRAHTVARLHRVLLTGRDAVDRGVREGVEEVVDLVERLGRETAAHPADLHDLVAAVHRVAPRSDHRRLVARALDEHARACSAPTAAAHLVAALRDVQSGAFLRQSSRLEQSLDEQFGVDAGLLDPEAEDPRLLTWLEGTHVRAAVLGLWDGEPEDGRLTLTGVYDPTGTTTCEAATTVTVEHFPPTCLVQASHPEERELCFVVPVRSRARDWGLLALVATIETTSARETYHHWATLLASALEQQELEAAVQTSEERYALAAAAANDGLWEVDFRAGTFFASERCRTLLGLPVEGALALDRWERLVVDEDVDGLQLAMAHATAAAGVPIEHEFRIVGGDEPRWVLLRCLGVGPRGTRAHRLVGSLADIGHRKELESRLRTAALYDPVTGLPNRRLFLDRLTLAVHQPERRASAGFAVIFLDLDGFKLVNDSLGHLMGDELLKVIADRLRSDLRSVDTAARFGGDEFAVLLADPVPEEVLVIAERIQARIAQPVDLGGTEVSVTASIGIATSETGYTDPEDVLRDADTAMYDAKGTEPGSASLFDRAMHARATGRLHARGELRTALAEQQFVVHYQPIVALDGAGVSQFEALVRWQHPQRGLLLPGEFLPVMTDNATVVALGRWVLDEVCRQIAEWRRDGDVPVRVAVNLSHHEFWSRDLQEVVVRALAEHGVPAECLVLEITESVIMSDQGAARELMAALHALGVELHIDDFGTGQSSLHALRTLPVDALKIDGSFIRELGDVAQTTELVRVIVDMGRALGMEVVAECVETPAQAEHLQELGCDNAQGWLYARALPGAEAGALLGRSLALALR